MLLDQIMPVYSFNEVHTIHVKAPRSRTYRAIKEVTADEIPLFRALMTIRMLPTRLTGKSGRGEANWKKPLLDEIQKAGFVLLAEENDREIVIGTVGQFWKMSGGVVRGITDAHDFLAFNRKGYAKAAMNFHIKQSTNGLVTIRTETRIHALDVTSRRKFARYWKVVHPGSALIRAMWLRAIKRRAEQRRASDR